MPSRSLPLNAVKHFEMCGQQLVAFRGGSGVVHVLSAYCPHLGANLGIGGHVVTESGDDCIQCPFHGWRFGGDGQCKRIPNLNGVFISSDPDHYPEDFLAKYGHNLSFRFYYSRHMDSNFEVVGENCGDLEHFARLHGSVVPYLTTTKFSFDTTRSADNEIAGFATIYVLGFKLITQPWKLWFGSPVMVHHKLGYDNSLLGPVLGVLNAVPLHHGQTRLTTMIYSKPTILHRLWAIFYFYLLNIQADADMEVWVNTQKLKRPIFTRNDDLIQLYRRYCQRFYAK
ncbi:unnamed protein product [Medioppia subpectinata]|uniref:cholesterol 7-desaturase n=1 Tax=Medioppia subpectinata TaxID=1979941 RepID=A0A7R9KRX3_9ACAR|nr:unnamed protein product [Medioppia subpectinata]CAG2108243.1 unnamed protein product [Medioppia subpectinata]